MHQEMPSIATSTYASSALDPAALFLGAAGVAGNHNAKALDIGRLVAAQMQQPRQVVAEPKEISMTARIVKVFIADPNENIPLDKRVLYTGEEKLTDLTDQELFFEVPIKDLLDKHNTEVRTKTVDKKATKDREVFLEPIRIRDLKMVVVTVAQF